MKECSSLCEVQMYSLHHENIILPTKTPVLVPLTASTGTPASSKALYVHSISNFCCGSMRSASALLIPKRRLSNELNLKYMDQKTVQFYIQGCFMSCHEIWGGITNSAFQSYELTPKNFCWRGSLTSTSRTPQTVKICRTRLPLSWCRLSQQVLNKDCLLNYFKVM